MDAERAETHLRLMAEAGLRRALRPGAGPSSEQVARVRAAGAVLAAVGAIDAERARAIAEGLQAALNLRSRGHRGGPWSLRGPFAPWGPAPWWPGGPAARRVRPGEAGKARVVPVGQVLMLRNENAAAGLWLLSLVRTAFRAQVAVTGRMHEMSSFGPPFHRLKAIDDRRNAYRVDFSGTFSEDRADGWISIDPVPPGTAAWVEFYSEGATGRLRVDITAEPTPARVLVEPGGPASLAERLLDATAEAMLGRFPESWPAEEDPDEIVATMRAVGVLPPRSAAAGRLAALCQRAGTGRGRQLAAAVAVGVLPAVDLPEPWTSVLAYFGRRYHPAGRRGVAPVAVSLPELDGVRFTLTGLWSEPDETLLHVAATGLPENDQPHATCGPWISWFPWWARDSAGQWHVTEIEGYDAGDGGLAALRLRLVPPLPRTAGRLELVVPGRTARIRATIPLDWAEPHD